MAVFIGTFENKVDRKGRVSVPAPFRASLTGLAFQGIIAFPARNGGSIEACGMDLMEQMIAEQDRVNLLSNQAGIPTASIFYELQQLSFDGDGRIILPTDLREKSAIDGQATFVGIGKLFQIWAPERLAAFRAEQAGGRGMLRT